MRLHDQFDIRGNAEHIGNGIGRTGQQATFNQNHVGGMAFERSAQILKRVGLSHNADIVFERKYFANSHAINSLRIRKDNADGPRLHRCVENFAIRCFVEKFHRWLLKAVNSGPLLLHEMIFIDSRSSLIMTLAYGAAYHTSTTVN